MPIWNKFFCGCRPLPVERKIPKTTRKYHFPWKLYFRVVFSCPSSSIPTLLINWVTAVNFRALQTKPRAGELISGGNLCQGELMFLKNWLLYVTIFGYLGHFNLLRQLWKSNHDNHRNLTMHYWLRWSVRFWNMGKVPKNKFFSLARFNLHN